MPKKKTAKKAVTKMDFPAVKSLKAKMQTRPELEKKLRKDLAGTLKAEGFTVDAAFRKKLEQEWRAGMKADLRRMVAEDPRSKNWYLKRVVEGKPLKIQVTVNPKTGKITKKLGGAS